MLGIFRLVPLWAWVVAAALGYGWLQRHQALAAVAEQAGRESAVHKAREDALHGALVEQTRRMTAQQEVVDESTRKARRAEAAADRARAALDGLQQRAARANGAGAPSADPAASGVGLAAAGTSDLCADVLGRIGAAARDLAEESDRRGTAGAECVGLYNALTPTQRTP